MKVKKLDKNRTNTGFYLFLDAVINDAWQGEGYAYIATHFSY
jgi:hypothetical protein